MFSKKTLARFLIVTCGLKRLHGGGLQKMIRSVLDEIDFQNFRERCVCPSAKNRDEMFAMVHDIIRPPGTITYLEFGVHKGDSIKKWITLNKESQSCFFGFDSFEGLPEGWTDEKGKGFFDVGGNIPEVDDARVTFIKGWFEDTLPKFVKDFNPQNRLIIHLDADLYSSTMVVLMELNRFIKPGTLLMFDEFYDREHEYKALMDYQKISGKKVRGVAHLENFSKVCLEIL